MKLPLDFGLKLFFRLLLPGFFLTIGLLPVILGVLDATGLKGQREAAFVIAVIISGWLFVAADLPVYMLLEGRRFWPARWVAWGKEQEERRLEDAMSRIAHFYARGEGASEEDRRQWLEASVEVRRFPVSPEGEWHAVLPTRLGNTITAFELYSKTRYGIDSVFYWPRIWINLDKDLREEVDGQQAMADSTVYSTVALGAAGLLWIAYGVLIPADDMVAGILVRRGIAPELLPEGIFSYLPGLPACLLIGVSFLLLARCAYLLSVYVNDQFGGVFTAIIDSHAGKLATEYVAVEKITHRVGTLAAVKVEDGEKLEVASRYLRYFSAKLPGRARAVPVPQVGDVLAGDEPHYTRRERRNVRPAPQPPGDPKPGSPQRRTER